MMALRWGILLLAGLMISACGFQLRGKDLLGEHFSQLHVASNNPHAPLVRTFRDRLSRYSVDILPQPSEQSPTVYLYPERLERSLLSLFATGQVAEYELNYHIRFEVKQPGLDAQLFEFSLSREYQDDPNAVLAKSRELNLILDELRQRASDRIIRQLSRLSGVSN